MLAPVLLTPTTRLMLRLLLEASSSLGLEKIWVSYSVLNDLAESGHTATAISSISSLLWCSQSFKFECVALKGEDSYIVNINIIIFYPLGEEALNEYLKTKVVTVEY